MSKDMTILLNYNLIYYWCKSLEAGTLN